MRQTWLLTAVVIASLAPTAAAEPASGDAAVRGTAPPPPRRTPQPTKRPTPGPRLLFVSHDWGEGLIPLVCHDGRRFRPAAACTRRGAHAALRIDQDGGAPGSVLRGTLAPTTDTCQLAEANPRARWPGELAIPGLDGRNEAVLAVSPAGAQVRVQRLDLPLELPAPSTEDLTRLAAPFGITPGAKPQPGVRSGVFEVAGRWRVDARGDGVLEELVLLVLGNGSANMPNHALVILPARGPVRVLLAAPPDHRVLDVLPRYVIDLDGNGQLELLAVENGMAWYAIDLATGKLLARAGCALY